MAQYSPLLTENQKRIIQSSQPQQFDVKNRFSPHELQLSELGQFLNKQQRLNVPVYTVWGACEDVRVLEKFRSGEYKVDNLHIIDEAGSRLLEIGGIKLRLLGLGGAVVMHKLFDNGEGKTTIAGGQGTMWTTLLQMGELVDTANRVYDPTETRVFITHASPAREGLLNQLSVTLKADFSISAGLHFRYGSSYNEFSVNPTLDHYRGKLAASKASFNDVWETVKTEVEPAVSQNEAQRILLDNALEIVNKMPSVANGGNPFGGSQVPGAGIGTVDESAFKNMWNFNLADAAFGYLVLEIQDGRIGTEMRAQGFNFAHRSTGQKPPPPQAVQAPVQPSNANIAANRVPSGPNQSQPQYNQAQPRNQQPPQARPAPPSQQPSQAQQNKPPPAQARAPAPSSNTPQPNVVKPATPQPTAPSSGSPKPPAQAKTPSQAPDTRNGTADKPVDVTKPEDRVRLFLPGVETEENAREVFADDDKAKIVKVDHTKQGNFIVHFGTNEDAESALKNQKGLAKTGGGFAKAKWFEDHRGKYPNARPREGPGGQGAGSWQGSNRQVSNTGRPSYQSGASDSEGGRGRGNFPRGGRGRGGDRGGRGAGRGGRGGAKAGEESTSAPAQQENKAPAPSGGGGAASAAEKS